MSVRFPYLQVAHGHPIVSLDGRQERPRPVIPVTVIGPRGGALQAGLLDTGADDTLFPERVATLAGIDLTNAPLGSGAGVGKGTVAVRYARVTLRIADNQEQREWQAWVGFAATGVRYPMLGFAGFLQYFTVTFHGDREEVELRVNSLYAGT
jgi:hypothetical protein